MKRVRWHQAGWTSSFRSLTNSMRRHALGPNDDEGFIIQRTRTDSIEAFHVEKVVVEEILIDPFNNKQAFERTSYKKVDFQLSTDFPQLEIRDPPRLTNTFFGRLSEATAFELSITTIPIDLARWVTFLEETLREPLLIDMLQVSGLELDKGIGASVLLRGNHDVRHAMSKLTQRKPHILDRMHLRLPMPGGGLTAVTLHRTGAATLGSEQGNEVLKLLRGAFAAAFDRGPA